MTCSEQNRNAVTVGLAITAALFLLLVIPRTVQAQTFTVLHAFSGPDGSFPVAHVTLDSAGNIYGTASEGGSNDAGTAFKLSRRNGGWVFSVLYNFYQSPADGAAPQAMVLAPDGTLVGSTRSGGGVGLGTLFVLRPPATFCPSFSCPWEESFVYRFQGGSDGCDPANIVSDGEGNILGVTADDLCQGWGTVYKLTPSGGSWTKTNLYTFSGQEGAAPNMPLAIDASGNLYSTTEFTSGSGFSYYGYGTVYQLVHSGSSWTLTSLYTFPGPSVGQYPTGVVLDSSGNLEGTTLGGGTNDAGIVFQLVPGLGTFNTILSFSGEANCGPPAPLTADSAGNLYGVTECDGSSYGSVFELTPTQGGWNYTLLHAFRGGSDGAYPWAGVVLDASGNIYGTTAGGGNNGDGTVWEITP